jgi:hypothetical protein
MASTRNFHLAQAPGDGTTVLPDNLTLPTVNQVLAVTALDGSNVLTGFVNPPPAAGMLPLTGGTMTGPITLAGNAVQPLQAVPLQQVSTVPVTATGSTTSRVLADRFADLINVRDFGADNTGAATAHTAIAAAVTYAASFTPPRGIFFPAGIYALDSRIVLANGVDFYANPGTVIIRASAANAGAGGLIFGTTTTGGISDFMCYGIQFDAPSTTNMQPAFNLGPPISNVVFDTCVFRDMINPCLSFSGGTTLLALTLQGANLAGSTTLTFAASAVPSWVVAGTPLLGTGLFRGCRAVSSTGTVVTINAPLINSASAGSGLGTVAFVPTKLTNQVSPGGVPTIFMDTTTAVIPKIGDIVAHPSVVYGAKIITVTSGTISLDQPLQADIPLGDAVSYIAGANRVTVRDCQFYNIGNKGLNNGTVALTTTALANSGTSVLTVASTAGVWVGTAKVTGTPPAGVTLNDPVRATTQTTITLTTPLTANLPSGSVVTFVTYGAISDTAIAVFFTNGAPFANYDNVVENCTFERIGQVAIEASYQQNFTAKGNRMSLGLQQWRAGATGAAGAGGGAFYIIRCSGVRLIDNDIDGSVASGFDTASNTDIQFIGNTIRRCGACGISVGATDGGVIIGNKIHNCYQSANWYDMANLSHAAGIQFAGTSTGVAGVCQNIVVSGNTIMDTQTMPTMPFGIGLLGNTTLTNIVIDSSNIVAGMPTYSPVGGPGGFYLAMLGNTSGTRRLLNPPVTSVGNGADLTEDTLQSFTIPSAQLRNVGDIIRVKAGGTMGATTDVKAARVRMAGSNMAQVTSAVAGGTAWAIEVDVQKTGPSAQILSGWGLAQSTVVTALTAATVLTDTGTIALTVTGQNTTNPVAGSITCRYLTVEYLPA